MEHNHPAAAVTTATAAFHSWEPCKMLQQQQQQSSNVTTTMQLLLFMKAATTRDTGDNLVQIRKAFPIQLVLLGGGGGLCTGQGSVVIHFVLFLFSQHVL